MGSLFKKDINRFKEISKSIRSLILEMCIDAGFGHHIAPAFSCIDILVALYYGGILRINPNNPTWKERDRFILSKGHVSMAVYAILADLGFFPKSELNYFCKKGGKLWTHADNSIPGIETCTGSLGHGLSIGAGLALAAKIDNKKYITTVLLGDGECHEGSIWEAAMFAAQHRLGNLVAIIDHNGISATDFLRNYLEIKPLDKKWRSFGWDVVVVNGHSFRELIGVLKIIRSRANCKPLAIIAITTKGKGVSFMENNPIWHYRVPQGKELLIARQELGLIKKEK